MAFQVALGDTAVAEVAATKIGIKNLNFFYGTFQGLRNNTLPLDTGCVWGGCLTAARLGATAGEFELIAVKCEQAQQPATD